MYKNNCFIPLKIFGDVDNPNEEEKKEKKKPSVERDKNNKNEDKYNLFVKKLYKKQKKNY